MSCDDVIRIYSFKNCPLTFANTGITLTNKAFLMKAILDAVLCSFLIELCSLIDIT